MTLLYPSSWVAFGGDRELAEMVILDADPLVDVKNLARIHRVIHRGQLLDPDQFLRSIRS